MIFGGLQKNSLIDYPGKISCVLFVSGCNFRCPYCHNPALAKGCVADDQKIEEKNILDFLEERSGFLDGVVISGGEPTIQKGIFSFLRKLKKMGYPVKLDTNGSRPEILERLISERLLNYVAMDVKSNPYKYNPFITVDAMTGRILASIRTIMESNIDYEFRTTCVKPMVDENAIEDIARTIKGARLFALQHFNNREVLNPDFFADEDTCLDLHDLERLQSIAEPWVEKCIVR
jgi:pyruvate formate lyase activating enzyme